MISRSDLTLPHTHSGRAAVLDLWPRRQPWIVAGFYLSLVMLAAISVFIYQQFNQLFRQQALLTQTLQVEEGLHQLHAAVSEAESGQRGYILTGDQAFLQPYDLARQAIPVQLCDLRQLLRDRPEAARLLVALDGAIQEKLTLLQTRVLLHQKGDRAGALESIRSKVGLHLMTDIRQGAGAISQANTLLLQQYQQAVQLGARRAFMALGGGLVVGLGALAVIFHRLQGEIARRRRTEDALRLSEERLRVFMENSPALSFMKDETGRYLYVNGGMEHLTRWRPAELVGKTDADLWPEDVAQRLIEIDMMVLAEQRPIDLVTTVPDVDGHPRQFLIYKFPIPNHFGQRVIGGVAVDVTDHKLLEQDWQLKAALLDQVNDSIFVLDRQGRFHYVNEAAGRNRGYTREELLSLNLKDLLATEEAPQLVEPRMQELAERGGAQFNSLHRKKDGALLPVEVNARLVEIEGQQYVLSVARDMTARLEAEAARRRAEEDLRLVVRNMPALVFKGYLDGAIDFYDDKVEHLAGYSRTEFDARQVKWLDLMAPQDLRRAARAYLRALRGNGAYVREYRIRTRTGDTRWIQERATIIPTSQGEVDYISGVFYDITEQKRTEAALKQVEDEFRQVVNHMPTVLFKGFLDGGVEFFDDKVQAALGYSREEFNSRQTKWIDLILPEDTQSAKEVFIKALKGTGSYVREYRVRTRAGEIIWVQERSQIIRAADGQVDYISGVFFDITARKRGEQAILQSEAKYRHIFENSTAGIFQTAPDGRILSINPAIARILGFDSPEDMLATVPNVTVLYASPQRRVEFRQALEAHGAVRDFEAQLVRPDGQNIWISLNAQAMRDARGDILHYEGFIEDITARRAVEEALRDSEERYRGVFDTSPDIVGQVDLELNIILINQTAAIMLRVDAPQTLLGKNLLQYVAPKSQPVMQADAKRLLETGALRNAQWLMQRADGSQFWGEGNAYLMRDDQGRPTGFTGSIRDVTQRRQAQEKLEAERHRLLTLLEGLPAYVYLRDRNYNLRYVNRRFKEMFGDPAGRPCYEVLHGRAALCEVCASDKVFEEGQSHIWEWSAPQGFAFQIYDYPFTDTDGAPLVLELGIDITARKQAEEALKEKHAMVMRTLQGTVMALSAAVERRDPYTAGHQRRVTQLALALGREFGLDPERLEGLEVACLLHDIGKIAIPAEILSKPGMLNDFEFNMIKSHPQVAFEILKGIIFPWPVTQIIAQHHERVNGSGYPFGLEGEDILLESRILGVADVVEAMASHRPYRPALGIDEALAEVSQKQGVLYDPEVVAACLRLFKEQGFTLE